MQGANVLLLYFTFASHNICFLGVLGLSGKCTCGWKRERTGVHHNFAPICYLLGVNGIRVQNIYPTTFAPHVWHLGGKFEVNLPHLPHHPNTPIVDPWVVQMVM
jgi:hypothetical protein